jgi:hypothetical protein
MYRMHELVQRLEVTLGDDTGDLTLRVGLHSGAVTAGVLRGEKSRYQLFGDTVKTASRMESTGQAKKIQCSESTAEFLRKAGKQDWLCEREDVVHVKGKGEMKTFWVATRAKCRSSSSMSSLKLESVFENGQSISSGVDSGTQNSSGYFGSGITQNSLADFGSGITQKSLADFGSGSSQNSMADLGSGSSQNSMVDLGSGSQQDAAGALALWSTKMLKDSQISNLQVKNQRLVEFNVEILSRLIKQIVARRNITSSKRAPGKAPKWEGSGRLVVDEVAEIIAFPKFEPYMASIKTDPDSSIELGHEVTAQLRDFVTKIANMYKDNPFHNWEHASHVAMGANKLINRLLATQVIKDTSGPLDYTSRIGNDPLARFSVILAAVIHDVDHTGVSNMDLINNKAEIAAAYKNKSVAEQVSRVKLRR